MSSPLRCVLDAGALLGRGGIRNYLWFLFQELMRRREGSWRIELFFRQGLRGRSLRSIVREFEDQPLGRAIFRGIRFPDRWLLGLWDRGCWVASCRPRSGREVFLATTAAVPPPCRGRVGWFVYDLTPIRIPRFFGNRAAAWVAEMRQKAERADFLITISESTRRDLLELLGVPEHKVCRVPPGVVPPAADGFPPPAPAAAARPYVLYVGALSLNKNVDGLLRIFARCVRDHGFDGDLVLAGKDFCGTKYWLDLAHALEIANRIRLLGWVSESEKTRWLRGARMLWNFSWYEGFGLPVLEAASLGVPVLCSNRGALPEILANPDQEIDPEREGEAAARAAEALDSPSTLRVWGERGRRRAREFSWKRSAESLAERIESAVG